MRAAVLPWSEGTDVCLPASHDCRHAKAGLWDLVHGCGGRPGCYGDRYAAIVGSLEPDNLAPLGIDPWLAGQDPGLRAIESELRQPAAP